MTAALVGPSSNFDGRVTQLLRRVAYRRADSVADKDAIFRLRYRAYLQEGAIPPNPSQRFADSVDDARNTWIFGVYIDDELAGSIRFAVTIPGYPALPAFEVFSDVLAAEIAAGKTIIDPSKFVAHRESSRRYPELPYVVLRLPWMAMEYFNADLMLAAVRSEHQAFYKRLWGNEVICSPRRYPGMDMTVGLMTCNYRMVRDEVQRRHPFFQSDILERRMLFDRGQ